MRIDFRAVTILSVKSYWACVSVPDSRALTREHCGLGDGSIKETRRVAGDVATSELASNQRTCWLGVPQDLNCPFR